MLLVNNEEKVKLKLRHSTLWILLLMQKFVDVQCSFSVKQSAMMAEYDKTSVFHLSGC